jgi:hypothetical protein
MSVRQNNFLSIITIRVSVCDVFFIKYEHTKLDRETLIADYVIILAAINNFKL